MEKYVKVPSPMTRPAIGCTRISTHGQRDGYGQADQAAEITRYAETNGYDLLEIVEERDTAIRRAYELALNHGEADIVRTMRAED